MAELTVKKARGNQQPKVDAVKEEVVVEVSVEESSEESTYCVLAVDNGGYNTKILADYMNGVPVSILSHKGFGRDMGVFKNFPIPNDGQSYLVEIDGELIFTGSLLLNASGKMNPFVNDKSDDFYIYSILMACALHGADYIDLITCIPIFRYQDKSVNDKNKIIAKLMGDHEVKINHKLYRFTIENVLISPETMVAPEYLKPEGTTRWLDIGSRTVGYASTLFTDGEAMPLLEQSGTIEREGLNIRGVTDWKAYVSNIMYVLDRIWERDDRIMVFGGGSLVEPLIKEFKKHYSDFNVVDDPAFLQVKAMLEVGLKYFNLNEGDAND